MDAVAGAGVLFATVAAGVIAFQIALALGAPWGSFAMGGGSPGPLSTGLRAAAVVQAALLAVAGAIVLSRAGLGAPSWFGDSPWLIWFVVAISLVAVVLNAISRSSGERRLWVPVALVMLGSSLLVALVAG